MICRVQELSQLTDWLERILNLPPSARIIVDDNFDLLLWNQQAEVWRLFSPRRMIFCFPPRGNPFPVFVSPIKVLRTCARLCDTGN